VAGGVGGFVLWSTAQGSPLPTPPTSIQLVVAVPDVTGLRAPAAIAALVGAGFTVRQVHEASTVVPAGGVFSVSPAPGSDLPHGSMVTLYVSSGPMMPSP
jgi:beta-lactam-binding protein with PASTA domain